MRTVHQVSALTGVSVRTLQHYDRIGLLHPSRRTEAGYRLYSDGDLETLQQILLFRELEFPLKDIQKMLRSPGFDREEALKQQIRLLQLRQDRLARLIALARSLQTSGGEKAMDFSAFDTRELDAYAAEAKAAWGDTAAYREYEEKAKDRPQAENARLQGEMMEIFRAFGKLRQEDPAGPAAQALVVRLRDYITAHFYTCTGPILLSLGQMYASGGSMTENSDQWGGQGTAAYAAAAIRAFGENQA